MGITSMIHLSLDIKNHSRIDVCCNSPENVMDLNQNTTSTKVLIFVLALAVALAIASATRN